MGRPGERCDYLCAEHWCAVGGQVGGYAGGGHRRVGFPGTAGDGSDSSDDLALVEVEGVQQEVIERLQGKRRGQGCAREVREVVCDDHVGAAGPGGGDYVPVVGVGSWIVGTSCSHSVTRASGNVIFICRKRRVR
jgi:hypothetical protein